MQLLQATLKRVQGGSLRLKSEKLRGKNQKAVVTQTSQAVPHLSTNHAQSRLTSEFGWDPVLLTQCGRHRHSLAHPALGLCPPPIYLIIYLNFPQIPYCIKIIQHPQLPNIIDSLTTTNKQDNPINRTIYDKQQKLLVKISRPMYIFYSRKHTCATFLKRVCLRLWVGKQKSNGLNVWDQQELYSELFRIWWLCKKFLVC